MKKILSVLLMSLGIGASAQISVSESFEGTALPAGWSSLSGGAATSASFGTSAGTACAGTKEVYKNLTSSTPDWFLIYSSTMSDGAALNYSFKYLASGLLINGGVSADYSVDGGSTWVDVLAPVVLNSALPIACTTVSGTIPAGAIPAGANFKFRLKALFSGSLLGGFNMGFDNVQLSQVATLATNETSVSKNTIRVYPTLFTDVLNISDAGKVKNATVINVEGRRLKAIENPGSTLHLEELKQGIYFVTLTLKDNSQQTIKVIKK